MMMIWPWWPITTTLIALSALTMFNVIVHLMKWISGFNSNSNSHEPLLRPGSLTFLYYLACCTHIAIIFVPVTYLLHSWSGGTSSAPLLLLLLALAVHTSFWLVCLWRLIYNRHRHEVPLTLVGSYAAVAVLSVGPLVCWTKLFPEGFATDYALYYLVECLFVFTLFLLIASRVTLKQEYYTPWHDFFTKCKKIWPYMYPKDSARLQFYILLCSLTLVLGRVVNIAVPLYNKWIVDALSGPEPRFCYDYILISTTLKFLQGNGGGFLNTIRVFLWIRVQQYTSLSIEIDMFEHLHRLSLKWHLSRKTGEVIRIMDRGTSSINNILSYILFNVLPTIVDIILASIFFFYTFNAYFGLLVIFTMAIYLAVTIGLTEWRSKYRKAMNESENKSTAIGVDSLINYETIKHYNAEGLEVERYKTAYEIYQSNEYLSNASLAFLNLNQNVIIGLSMASGSLLAAWMISSKSNNMTVGDFVLFTSYILQLYGPLNFFGTIYRTIQRSLIDMENMIDLFKEDIDIADAPNAIPLEKCAGLIEFSNVRFCYQQDRTILHDISFTVNPGETVALVGPSGCGKTSIIRLLFRLYDTTAGTILFNGHDIRHLQLKSLRERIGIVPQDTVLFNETIRFNIRYGRPSATDEEVEEAAKAAAIHDFIISHPDGYNCMVGERGLKLSGGEKQRVAIARTILKGPEYILLDEATSALDSRTERSIQRYLFELCQQRTSVIVAHRLSTIIHADKILVLNEGRIVETGRHEELCNRPNGVYAEMWAIQNKSAADGDGDQVVISTTTALNGGSSN